MKKLIKNKFCIFFIIIFSGCIHKIGKQRPKDYHTGLREIAYSFANKIEKDKKVVVLNFTSRSDMEKGIPHLNIYFGHIFSSYLSQAAAGNFSVIDREKGAKIVAEDLKFEVGDKDWKAVLEEFQCDYYVLGEYILSAARQIEFVDISLMKGPTKIYSKSERFALTEEEYSELKEMAYGDAIEKIIESAIQVLEIKAKEITNPIPRLGIEAGITALKALLNEYKECKTNKDCKLYNQLKGKIMDKFYKLSSYLKDLGR